MNKHDPEYSGLFQKEEGLWAAVLMDILEAIEEPENTDSYERARRIVMEPENGCLPLIAAALDVETDELQRMILRHMAGKRIIINVDIR